MDDIKEDLKVFRDCTVDEFMNIFGPRCDQNMPLFANLFILRESWQYNRYLTSEAVKFSIPVTVGLNTLYYFMLRRYYIGKSFRFNRFARTLALFSSFFGIRHAITQ